jgi:cytochrome bd-type quinol oxidase subunit 1
VPFGLVAGSAPPWAALASAAVPLRWLHFLLGALTVATATTVTRWAWRPESRSQPALKAALTVLLVLLLLQAGAGMASAWQASALQPMKMAAMTAAWKVPPSGALRVFGLPEEWVQETRFGLRVPGLAQALGMSTDGTHDLRPQPAHLRPWVAASYALFHLKVVGWALLLGLAGLLRGLVGRLPGSRALRLVAYLLVVPAVFTFLSGVVVGELGRQPWLVAGEMFVGEGFVGVPGTAWALLLLLPGGAGLVCLRRALARARKVPAA